MRRRPWHVTAPMPDHSSGAGDELAARIGKDPRLAVRRRRRRSRRPHARAFGDSRWLAPSCKCNVFPLAAISARQPGPIMQQTVHLHVQIPLANLARALASAQTLCHGRRRQQGMAAPAHGNEALSQHGHGLGGVWIRTQDSPNSLFSDSTFVPLNRNVFRQPPSHHFQTPIFTQTTARLPSTGPSGRLDRR